MIKDLTVNAHPRDGIGKGFARRLRADGLVPAAVYGKGEEPVAIAVSAKDLTSILRSDSGHNTVFKLQLPGEKGEPATVIIKDWQVEPIKGRILHADLLRLSMTTTTRVRVPIEPVGEPVGVKSQGGLFDIVLREIEVECLPGDIPESLKVDVSGLSIGEHATVADLQCDREKVRILIDEHQIVAGILAPRLVEAPAPVAEEAPVAAEPEVAKKGKAEEEAS